MIKCHLNLDPCLKNILICIQTLFLRLAAVQCSHTSVSEMFAEYIRCLLQ